MPSQRVEFAMAIVQRLEGSGAADALGGEGLHGLPHVETRTPKSVRPVDMGPRPPAWTRSASHSVRAQWSVGVTLAIVVVAMLAFIVTRPRIAHMHAWIEAERPLIELRLSLAELRAIISDYHVEHGAFPGCDANGAANPRWFEREWQRAIERADALVTSRAGSAAARAGGSLDSADNSHLAEFLTLPSTPESSTESQMSRRVWSSVRDSEASSDPLQRALASIRLKPSDAPGGVPHNPVNGLATVRFLASHEPWPAQADDSTGWIYRPATGEIRANCVGNAFGSGPAYWDL